MWYQPKEAQTYSSIARYSKGDSVSSFCFRGAGTTTYFQATGSLVTLSGATTLFASAIIVGSALTLAM